MVPFVPENTNQTEFGDRGIFLMEYIKSEREHGQGSVEVVMRSEKMDDVVVGHSVISLHNKAKSCYKLTRRILNEAV